MLFFYFFSSRSRVKILFLLVSQIFCCWYCGGGKVGSGVGERWWDAFNRQRIIYFPACKDCFTRFSCLQGQSNEIFLLARLVSRDFPACKDSLTRFSCLQGQSNETFLLEGPSHVTFLFEGQCHEIFLIRSTVSRDFPIIRTVSRVFLLDGQSQEIVLLEAQSYEIFLIRRTDLQDFIRRAVLWDFPYKKHSLTRFSV